MQKRNDDEINAEGAGSWLRDGERAMGIRIYSSRLESAFRDINVNARIELAPANGYF